MFVFSFVIFLLFSINNTDTISGYYGSTNWSCLLNARGGASVTARSEGNMG